MRLLEHLLLVEIVNQALVRSLGNLGAHVFFGDASETKFALEMLYPHRKGTPKGAGDARAHD